MSDNHYSTDSDNDIPRNDNHTAVQEDDTGTIYLTSYSHKRGPLVPTPDISFDLRTLPNPPKNVRSTQTGIHPQLREWIFSNPEVQPRFEGIYGNILEMARKKAEAGQNELHVGIFCQMGRHRSVTFVEELGRRKFDKWSVDVSHRDLHLKRSDTGHRGRERLRDTQESD